MAHLPFFSLTVPIGTPHSPRTTSRSPVKLPFAGYIKAHHISHAALCVTTIVAALVFFVGGAGLRLLWGPVSLGPLKGTLAGAIHDALPGIALDYDEAAIEWSRDQGRINLVVLGARIYDSQGQVVARAPEAAIDLAAAPFLHGKVVVRHITLIGVEFTLVHMASGQIRLGTQTKGAGDDIIGRISDVIDAHGSESSSLESFAVRNATVGIYDEVTGLHVTAQHAGLVLRSKGDAVGTSFDADVMIAGRKSHVTVDLTLPTGKGSTSGSANVTGLDLRALSDDSKYFAGAGTLPLVANASANFRINPNGTLATAAFDIRAKGEIPYAAMKGKALHVNDLRLVGRYDGASRHLVLDSADLKAREARAVLKGTGDFFYDGAGKLERMHGALTGRNIVLDMPGVFAQPVGYQSLGLVADYLIAPRQFNVASLNLAAPGFSLNASGAVALNDKGAPGIVVKATIPALPVRTLLKYWPLPVAPGAREWIDDNIFAGTIGPLVAQTNFTPGMLDQDILPEDSMMLTFAMRNLEGNYVKGLTHATGVMGDAVMTGDTFKASFTSGHIGPLTVSHGTALIPTCTRRARWACSACTSTARWAM